MPLSLLSADLWADLASDLSVRSLGRLEAVELRFSRTTITIATKTKRKRAKAKEKDKDKDEDVDVVDHWSLVDEAARRALEYRFSRAPHARSWIPRRPGERWLKLLRELDQLQDAVFSRKLSNPEVCIDTSGQVASCSECNHKAAVSNVPMRAGRHYAEFTQLYGGWPGTEQDMDGGGLRGGTGMGVVGDGFDACHLYQHMYGRHARPARDTKYGWMLQTCDDEGGDGGCLGHNLGVIEDSDIIKSLFNYGFDWPGQLVFAYDTYGNGVRRMADGDVVGLLLDIDEGSLAVYLNGKRCGIMMQRGSGLTKNRRGEVPDDLKPPLRWAVDVGWSSSIHMETRKPPPPKPDGGGVKVVERKQDTEKLS